MWTRTRRTIWCINCLLFIMCICLWGIYYQIRQLCRMFVGQSDDDLSLLWPVVIGKVQRISAHWFGYIGMNFVVYIEIIYNDLFFSTYCDPDVSYLTLWFHMSEFWLCYVKLWWSWLCDELKMENYNHIDDIWWQRWCATEDLAFRWDPPVGLFQKFK